MRTACLIVALLLLARPVSAQDNTLEPSPPDYRFEFPLPEPDADLIDAAYACIGTEDGNSPAAPDPDLTCRIAQDLSAQAEIRGQTPPSQDEIALFMELMERNVVYALHLPILAGFYNQVALVAPPAFVTQPIKSAHLYYSFAGLGSSVEYDVTINATNTPASVSGELEASSNFGVTVTSEPLTLPTSVDVAVVQGLALALSDLVPIGAQFTAAPCWDYYPDWVVTLTLADGTTLDMVTNASNVVSIGGPWQLEIDGQNYMQYSNTFAQAVIDLFAALDIPFGETMAMGCGGLTNPLLDGWPQ